jgi:hypothetical protein
MFAHCPNCGFWSGVEAKTMDEAVHLANEGKLTIWCLKCDFHGCLPIEEQAKFAQAS